MTLEEWSYVSQIFGVVLVVVTLVYLALQIRQGTQLLLSEARQVALTTDQGGIYKFIDFPVLGRSMSGPDTPTLEEKTQLMFWIISQMRAREHEWLQYEAGALDGDAWLSYRDVIFFVLGTPRNRELWALCSGYFNKSFVKIVEDMMKDAVHTDFWHRLESIH